MPQERPRPLVHFSRLGHVHVDKPSSRLFETPINFLDQHLPLELATSAFTTGAASAKGRAAGRALSKAALGRACAEVFWSKAMLGGSRDLVTS